MKFTLGNQVNPTNTFQVEIKFMHGDGNAFTTNVVDIGLVVTDAIPCLTFFDACLQADRWKNKGTYSNIPGYYESEEDEESQWDIPADSEYTDYDAYVSSVELYWYNSIGVKHGVTYESD